LISNDVTKCSEDAYQLILKGEITEAVRGCEEEPCASHSIYCQRFLGWQYYGMGSFETALKWFGLAAEAGDIESIYGLACTLYGQGSYLKAVSKYVEASDLGDYRAYYWLGYMHEFGLGVNIDLELARGYYLNGSEKGYLMPERALIQMTHRYGTLVERIFITPRFLCLFLKIFRVALRDHEDESLADVQAYELKKDSWMSRMVNYIEKRAS
jgi:TPR repeat protein